MRPQPKFPVSIAAPPNRPQSQHRSHHLQKDKRMSAPWTASTSYWLRMWALPIVARAVLDKDPVVRKLKISKSVRHKIKLQNEAQLQRKTAVAQKVAKVRQAKQGQTKRAHQMELQANSSESEVDAGQDSEVSEEDEREASELEDAAVAQLRSSSSTPSAARKV